MVLLFDLLKRKQASSESSADGTAAVPSDVDVAKRKVSRRPIGRDSAWAFASHLDVVDSPEPSARASRSGPTVHHGSDVGGSVGSSGRLLSASLSISRSSLGVVAPPARSSRGFFSTPFEDGPGGQSRAQSASSGRAMSLQEMGRIRQQESSTGRLLSSSLAATFSPRRSSGASLDPMSGWNKAQAAGSRRVAASLTAWLDGRPPFPASRPEGWRFVPLV